MALTQLSEETVRNWFAKFRKYLPYNQNVLEHIVQLDEAFFKTITLMMGKQQGTRKLAFEIFHHAHPDKLPGVVSEFCVRFSSPEIFESPLTYLQKTLTFVPFD